MTVKVNIIESEAGWGSKIDETLEFPDRASAEKYVKDYNNKHNPIKNQTPDWYMYACIEGDYGVLR